LGDDLPMPDARICRITFSMRSHKPTSYNFPVNIGVGNSMTTCLALNSAGGANRLA
jgi:hypothetical protein